MLWSVLEVMVGCCGECGVGCDVMCGDILWKRVHTIHTGSAMVRGLVPLVVP